MAGCGGLVRDHSGRWLCGFAQFIGTCSVLEAELRGLMEGLKLGFSRGWHKVLVQLDLEVACNISRSKNNGRLAGWSLI